MAEECVRSAQARPADKQLAVLGHCSVLRHATDPPLLHATHAPSGLGAALPNVYLSLDISYTFNADVRLQNKTTNIFNMDEIYPAYTVFYSCE